jgi:hypothetical protein
MNDLAGLVYVTGLGNSIVRPMAPNSGAKGGYGDLLSTPALTPSCPPRLLTD